MLHLVEQAEDDGDTRAAARHWGNLMKAWELEAKFLGELNAHAQHVTTNITIQPAYIELRVALVNALRDFPDARRTVAQVLQTIETRAIEDAGGDAQTA